MATAESVITNNRNEEGRQTVLWSEILGSSEFHYDGVFTIPPPLVLVSIEYHFCVPIPLNNDTENVSLQRR